MKVIVTGCAGFIGSALTDYLLKSGYEVIGVDNLSTGQFKFLENALRYPSFNFINEDLLNLDKLKKLNFNADIIFHLAANADVRHGLENTSRDLEQNTIVTFNVLEIMRHRNIKKIVFSSTGSVYGEASIIPTPETCPFPIQTSLYGASKVSCESLIAAYCEGFDFKSWIFRFVSILGERYTHGHVFDFYKQLKADPNTLKVLGDGTQKKSYLYIHDCIEAILIALHNSNAKVNIFNLGIDAYCDVNYSIDLICKELKVKPKITYSGGNKGWVGDNPFIYLDTKKINSLGWTPREDISSSIIKTVRYLKANEWIFNERN